MRYNSQRQEFFANNGRIEVKKETHRSGFYEYVVYIPDGLIVRKTNKKEAIDTAKVTAYRHEYAFNPMFDYYEVEIAG